MHCPAFRSLGFALVLPLCAGGILAQKTGQPAKPAPAAQDPTKTDPDTALPSEFARFVRVADGGHLDTAVTTYRNAQGVEVKLFGAVHIADTAHYHDLQQRFEACDALLYELVGPEDYRPQPGQRSGGAVSFLQRAMKSGLQLDFQLDAMDYRKANFVHADMTGDEFREAQTDAGESILGLMWQSMVAEMQRIREGGAADPAMQQFAKMDLVTAFRNGEGRHLMRMMFATQLQNVEKVAAGFGADGKGSVLVEGRNEKCLKVLQREIAAGKQRLGVYYGAAHLPHMEQRLTKDLGFHKVKHEWVQAWDCTKRPDKPAVGGKDAGGKDAGGKAGADQAGAGKETAATATGSGDAAELFGSIAAHTKIRRAAAEANQIHDAVETYLLFSRQKELPTLQDLLTKDQKGRAYLKGDGKDPWGNEYQVCPGDRPRSFHVRSAGPDGKWDTGDDVSSGQKPEGGKQASWEDLQARLRVAQDELARRTAVWEQERLKLEVDLARVEGEAAVDSEALRVRFESARKEIKARSQCSEIADAACEVMQRGGRKTPPAMAHLLASGPDGRPVVEGDGRDPWGQPYQILAGVEPGAVSARSAGPDGRWDTADDVSSGGLDDMFRQMQTRVDALRQRVDRSVGERDRLAGNPQQMRLQLDRMKQHAEEALALASATQIGTAAREFMAATGAKAPPTMGQLRTKRPDGKWDTGDDVSSGTKAKDGNHGDVEENFDTLADDGSARPAGEHARLTKVTTDLDVIGDAVKLYQTAKGKLPTMQDLMAADAGGKRWLATDSLDPWGRAYQIRPIKGTDAGFELRCAGPDGVMDTKDDCSVQRLPIQIRR